MPLKHIEKQGYSLCYQLEGNPDGPPLVLLHGFGEEADIWEGQVALLGDRYHILLPQFLRSVSVAEARCAATVEEAARQVVLMMQEEWNEKPALIFGHSMGGYIMLALAEAFPHRVKGLGLVHSTAYADSAEKKESRLKNMAFLRQHGAYNWLKQSMPNLFAKNYVVHQEQAVKTLIDKGVGFDAENMARLTEAMMNRPDRRALLKAIGLPVLFIIGEEDNAIMPASVLEQTHLPDISYIHILKNVGHMGMMEAPEPFNKALINYIETIQ
jgi:pimeloyl-ACP methyl ester carboxylesterase